MKQNYKIFILFALMLVQSGMIIAQQIPEKLYGTYKGKANTKLIQNEGKKVTNQKDKTFDVEIVKRDGETKLLLKNFSLEGNIFEEIVFDDLQAIKDNSKNRWNIFAQPLNAQFKNKADKEVMIYGSINDDYSFVYDNGTIELLFNIFTDKADNYEQDFKGNKDISNSIKNMANGKRLENVAYDLSGRRVMNSNKGIYIINGKKAIK